jgi:hypothetical protein
MLVLVSAFESVRSLIIYDLQLPHHADLMNMNFTESKLVKVNSC